MKQLRTNKIRSYVTFIFWIILSQLRKILPSIFCKDPIKKIKLENVNERVNYYCKLQDRFNIGSYLTSKDIPYIKNTGYNFDFHKIIEPFSSLKFNYLIGDIQFVPENPTFLRCRPIRTDNKNSVLLPLVTRRHFEFYDDPYLYENKIPKIVWRGAAYQDHRKQFLKAAFNLTCCDVGATNSNSIDVREFIKPWMPPLDQMRYKFLFVIEGNDVASNIQWAMNSNSLCFMRQPRYESWFCEGLLIPNVHYIEIADDFSNILERYQWATENPLLVSDIIKNANSYVGKFKSLNYQYALARRVVARYAELSSQ